MGVPNVGILPDFPCPICSVARQTFHQPMCCNCSKLPRNLRPFLKKRESYGHSMSFDDNASAMATATKHG